MSVPKDRANGAIFAKLFVECHKLQMWLRLGSTPAALAERAALALLFRDGEVIAGVGLANNLTR